MVATLVIVLPSSYDGGEIVVRHEGQEQTIDFTKVENNLFHNHFASFYADCEHEIRPVRKGYRLCLVYNLTLGKTRKTITAPRISEHLERIRPLIREWAKDDSQEKLAITLDHQYTKDGIAWETLKGVDRVKAQVLAGAARQEGCRAYLALLTFHEAGDAEYVGGRHRYGRRGRWYDDDDDEDEDDSSDYEMGEVFEFSLTAEQCIDNEGNGLPIGEMDFEEDEVLDSDVLREGEPEEDFEGYTGNAGMTLERRYRYAAILLWPERRHFEVLCSNGQSERRARTGQMVAKWRKTKGEGAAALKAQCIAFATAILAGVARRTLRSDVLPQTTEKSDPMKTLAGLGEPGLIHQYLGDVLVKDATADPGRSIAAVCQKYGWKALSEGTPDRHGGHDPGDDRAEHPAARIDQFRRTSEEGGMGRASANACACARPGDRDHRSGETARPTGRPGM